MSMLSLSCIIAFPLERHWPLSAMPHTVYPAGPGYNYTEIIELLNIML